MTEILDEFAAGAFAGCIVCFLFYPLEYLEVGSAKASLFSVMKSCYQRRGITGFYAGFLPTVIGAALNWGVYLTIYEEVKLSLGASAHSSMSQQIAAATVAGVITCAIVNPFWVLKIRLATNTMDKLDGGTQVKMHYAGMWDALWSISRIEGVGALWAGLVPSFLGVSEGTVQLVFYESLKFSMGSFMAGAMSKAIAVLLTYPYQVLRARLQAEHSPYHSLSECFQGDWQIVAREGAGALYQGMLTNLLRQLAPAGFTFYLVEYFKILLSTMRTSSVRPL